MDGVRGPQPKLTQVQQVQYRLQSATWYAWAAGLNLVRGHFACLRTQAIATVGYNQLPKVEGSPQIVSISRKRNDSGALSCLWRNNSVSSCKHPGRRRLGKGTGFYLRTVAKPLSTLLGLGEQKPGIWRCHWTLDPLTPLPKC